MRRHLAQPICAAALAASIALAGCGSGGGSQGCGPARSEPLDRRSLVHVLPGAEHIDYLTDPPTSGPHQPNPPVQGVAPKPIDRPVQVGILEAGQVLLQYRDLDSSSVRQLNSLAGPKVVVAPNPDLPAKVVATAWLTKQTCQLVDLPKLRTFATQNQNKGPK